MASNTRLKQGSARNSKPRKGHSKTVPVMLNPARERIFNLLDINLLDASEANPSHFYKAFVVVRDDLSSPRVRRKAQIASNHFQPVLIARAIR